MCDESQSFDLLALPNEVLERVFCNFNDDSLLKISHVCTRFISIAIRAFARKYANKSYNISGIRKIHRGFHCAILNKFGSVLNGIFIYKYDLIYDDKCLMDQIVNNCRNLKKFELIDVSINLERLFSHLTNLTYCSLNGVVLEEEDTKWSSIHLPNLKHLEIRLKDDIKYSNLVEFFDNNGQIEILFIDTRINAIGIINSRLKKLRSLKIVHYYITTLHQTLEPLSSLESLEILSVGPDYLLRVFETCCKNLKHLKLVFQHQKHLDDSTLETICSLNSLKSLSILYADIDIDQLLRLGTKNLTFLRIEMQADEELIENVLCILSTFKLLENVEIQFDAVSCPQKINYNFHSRYLVTIGMERDVELHLLFREEEIIVTKSKISRVKDGCEPLLIHWIGYESRYSISNTNILDLDEMNSWTIFDHIDLFTLTVLSQTCRSMDQKIRHYLIQKYEQNALNLIVYNNEAEWSNIFNVFGHYFYEINIDIPSSAFRAEPFLFSCINQFCTNLLKLTVKHDGCFDIMSPNFTLPKLQRFTYKNGSSGDIEVAIFANCPNLKRLELFGPIGITSNVLYEQSFNNLTSIKIQLYYYAVEFLTRLTTVVREQMTELGIYSYGVFNEIDCSNIQNIIAKFPNLNELHLIVPLRDVDVNLFESCKQITKLSILYDSSPADKSRDKSKFVQMQRCCSHLKFFQIYQYKNVCSVKDFQFFIKLYPYVDIKSILIDCDGRCCSINTISKNWLQTLQTYNCC